MGNVAKALSKNNFQCIKDTSRFNEDIIKYYNEESNEGQFLEVDGQYFQILHEIHNNLLFLPEGITVKKVEKVVLNVNDKLNILDT